MNKKIDTGLEPYLEVRFTMVVSEKKRITIMLP